MNQSQSIDTVILEGTANGEICNRNGCKGVISRHDSDSCCSCHLSAPCSYCTDSREFCSTCGWEGRDEQKEVVVNFTPAAYQPFKLKTKIDLDKSKIDWYYEGHSHFSMKKIGVYPEGATRNEVEEKVKGTFGGRFERFGNGEFIYIAYTD